MLYQNHNISHFRSYSCLIFYQKTIRRSKLRSLAIGIAKALSKLLDPIELSQAPFRKKVTIHFLPVTDYKLQNHVNLFTSSIKGSVPCQRVFAALFYFFLFIFFLYQLKENRETKKNHDEDVSVS